MEPDQVPQSISILYFERCAREEFEHEAVAGAHPIHADFRVSDLAHGGINGGGGGRRARW